MPNAQRPTPNEEMSGDLVSVGVSRGVIPNREDDEGPHIRSYSSRRARRFSASVRSFTVCAVQDDTVAVSVQIRGVASGRSWSRERHEC
jgi:hypothetical protein